MTRADVANSERGGEEEKLSEEWKGQTTQRDGGWGVTRSVT